MVIINGTSRCPPEQPSSTGLPSPGTQEPPDPQAPPGASQASPGLPGPRAGRSVGSAERRLTLRNQSIRSVFVGLQGGARRSSQKDLRGAAAVPSRWRTARADALPFPKINLKFQQRPRVLVLIASSWMSTMSGRLRQRGERRRELTAVKRNPKP